MWCSSETSFCTRAPLCCLRAPGREATGALVLVVGAAWAIEIVLTAGPLQHEAIMHLLPAWAALLLMPLGAAVSIVMTICGCSGGVCCGRCSTAASTSLVDDDADGYASLVYGAVQ